MDTRNIIVASIILYPLLALFIIKKIINKQNNTNSKNALDYYESLKRIIDYHYKEDDIVFDINKKLLPIEIDNNLIDKNEIQIKNKDKIIIKNNNFKHEITCINKELINNDFRDIGGIETKNGFISFNKIYRISNINNLDNKEALELNKTNYSRIFNLNNKIKLKNKNLVINSNNSVSINILSSINNVLPFLNQSKLDYFTWHAHVIFESIIDEKKNVGRLLKKIMKSDGPVIIQDGDGHYQVAVIIMLILMLLDVDTESIAREYSISNLAVKKDTTLKTDIHNIAVVSNPIVIKKLINNIDGTYDKREKFFMDLEINKELIDEFKEKMIIKY